MLVKIAGVAVVTKLRAILLMEADFNCHNRLIFGNGMMKLAREHGLVPEEIYSEKGKTPEDAILQQVLVYDIARQLRRPLMVALLEAFEAQAPPLNPLDVWVWEVMALSGHLGGAAIWPLQSAITDWPRYAELLTCGKHEYFLSRQEYNKSYYSTVARTRPAGSTSAWRPAKMLLPPALKMSAGATFVCVDHTLVAIGNGEGGKTHREQLANLL